MFGTPHTVITHAAADSQTSVSKYNTYTKNANYLTSQQSWNRHQMRQNSPATFMIFNLLFESLLKQKSHSSAGQASNIYLWDLDWWTNKINNTYVLSSFSGKQSFVFIIKFWHFSEKAITINLQSIVICRFIARYPQETLVMWLLRDVVKAHLLVREAVFRDLVTCKTSLDNPGTLKKRDKPFRPIATCYSCTWLKLQCFFFSSK